MGPNRAENLESEQLHHTLPIEENQNSPLEEKLIFPVQEFRKLLNEEDNIFQKKKDSE